jgi:hypothetical protein
MSNQYYPYKSTTEPQIIQGSNDTALICDFSGRLYNKQMTNSQVIGHLKKINKTNGYKYFSITIPRKLLKYIKGDFSKEDYVMKLTEKEEKQRHLYEIAYKDAVMVYGKELK